MKLISLNTWAGKAFEPFMAFLKKESHDADIFCFQEIFKSDAGIPVSRGAHMNFFEEIRSVLPDFEGFFDGSQDNINCDGRVDFPTTFGQAIFVRKSIAVSSQGSFFIHGARNSMSKDFGYLPTLLQYIRFSNHGKEFTVCNCYGVAQPGDKLDSEGRLEQSRRVVAFVEKEKGEKIVCGDFNLMPETESVKMIERAGIKNLITESGVTTTRSAMNYAKYPPEDRQHFADYTFVSPGVAVKRFEVPQIEISDHLPMILEFE